MFIKNQQGVGLLEVMVALMLLAIAVLGYAAMQVRATNVSLEADNQTRAVEFARDLHERMRVNREGMKRFQTTGTYTGGTPSTNCRTTNCTPENLAIFDFDQVQRNAENFAMSIAIHRCPNATAQRHCIYVAWGDTTPTIGNGATDCTDDNNVYRTNAQCTFMESFSYAK